MGCFGTGLGMLFHLYKGLDVTHELFKKIEKNSLKIAGFQLILSKGIVFFFSFLKIYGDFWVTF